jgi:hypothetical protein
MLVAPQSEILIHLLQDGVPVRHYPGEGLVLLLLSHLLNGLLVHLFRVTQFRPQRFLETRLILNFDLRSLLPPHPYQLTAL